MWMKWMGMLWLSNKNIYVFNNNNKGDECEWKLMKDL